ncbi:MAG: glycoside hydrolase family 10 protein, partial [Pseudanabaena sp.]
MPQDWRKHQFSHNLRHIFRQMLRPRKRSLSFLFVVTFATTLLLHSLIPSLLGNDQAIAQINRQTKPQIKLLVPPLKQPVVPPSALINQPIDKRQEIRGVWLTSNDFA